jgi:hypothetical protein
MKCVDTDQSVSSFNNLIFELGCFDEISLFELIILNFRCLVFYNYLLIIKIKSRSNFNFTVTARKVLINLIC